MREDLAWTHNETAATETDVQKNGEETINILDGDKTKEVRSSNKGRGNFANLLKAYHFDLDSYNGATRDKV